MFEETVQLVAKRISIRHEISSEFGSDQTCGPRELALAIQKVNDISPFLELSQAGLRNLLGLAYQISLKKEEARYPRFQMYMPPTRFFPFRNCNDPEWMIRFDPPIALDISTLHRISAGIPSRPYALYIWESEGTIEAYGINRIEDLSDQPKLINATCYPGLILSIESPGVLNVSLSNNSLEIVEHLTLRQGKIEFLYDPNTTLNKEIYSDIERSVRSSMGKELPDDLSKYIGNIWSYILSLAVNFGHGGQFIILPPGYSLDKDNRLRIENVEILQVKHAMAKPDLGSQIASLALEQDLIKELPVAQRTHYNYQALFDTARAVAKLSKVDGCLVFDRGLRLLGFKGEVLIKEDPECVELDRNYGTLKPKGAFDIYQYGTRHRSAARFCYKVPDAIVFVVSQDGDIRLFKRLDDGKVGISGPFYPLPGLSPAIVHG